MSVPYLQFSKIGKVMRHIAVLTDDKVPGDEQFKFRDRAKALVDRWHGVLNAGKPPGEKEANGDVVVEAGMTTYVKDEEKISAGTRGLDSSAGANGDGAFLIISFRVSGLTRFLFLSVDRPADLVNEAEGDADAVGDESMLADVTMSEGGM